MKKILQIGPSVSKAKGGMATVIKELTESSILSQTYAIDEYPSFADGPFLYRLFYSMWSFIRFHWIYQRYDIFHIHMASKGSTFRKGYYIKFLKKHKKKVVLHVHGSTYKDFYENLSEKQRAKVHSIWATCDKVLVLSDSWYDYFTQIFPNAKIVIVENGVDVEKYEAANTGMFHKNQLLFLGRLGHRKGAYDLIEAISLAIKERPDLHLFMAGDGELNEIKRVISQKGLDNHIECLGWVSATERLELLKKVGILVLPSYNEGLPMAILEAMAAGKVIISTTVGAIPEVVKSENGILLEPGDILGLTKALIKASQVSNWSEQAVAVNPQLIREFYSKEQMHNKIKVIYDILLTEAKE